MSNVTDIRKDYFKVGANTTLVSCEISLLQKIMEKDNPVLTYTEIKSILEEVKLDMDVYKDRWIR